MRGTVRNIEVTDIAAALNNKIDTVRSAGDLEGTLADFACNQGFDYFAFLLIGSPEIDAVSNYPMAWQRRYMQNSLFENDPVIEKARRVMRPFSWSGMPKQRYRSQTEDDFFIAAAEFGICSGLSLPILVGSRGIAVLTFASSRAASTQDASIDPVCAAACVGTLYGLLRQDLAEQIQSTVKLKKQERICLEWYAEGKTYGDIAEIEGMSLSNVCFQMANIRRKFGANSSAHALALALRTRVLPLVTRR